MPDQFTPFEAAAVLLRCAFPIDEKAPSGWHRLLATSALSAGLDGYVQFGSDLAALRLRLVRFASSLGCNPAEAEDLAQETLMRAWAARARFEPGTNLRAWTFTILRNRWLSARRRDRFGANYDEAVAEVVLSEDEQQTKYVELTEVMEAMDLLPDDQRLAFQAVILKGLSYEEAAQQLLLPLGTLKSRVSRGRAALKTLIEQGKLQLTQPPLATLVPEPDIIKPEKPVDEVPRRSAWAHAKANGRSLIIG